MAGCNRRPSLTFPGWRLTIPPVQGSGSPRIPRGFGLFLRDRLRSRQGASAAKGVSAAATTMAQGGQGEAEQGLSGPTGEGGGDGVVPASDASCLPAQATDVVGGGRDCCGTAVSIGAVSRR